MPKVYNKKSSSTEVIPNSYSMELNLFMMKDRIMDSECAFYQVNLGSVVQQFVRWKQLLPRVQPFFAVKCNPDPKVISLLGKLGAGFDCASKEEIKIVRNAVTFNSGSASKNIIYANPYKFKKDMIYASRTGVTLTTFDTESELIKLAKEWPSAQLMMRLSTERSYDATCVLGNKFGTDSDEVPAILCRAKELSMEIVGFSFHVGSGCKEMDAFPETVIYCSKMMDLARKIGFNPYILDIGGGFPGLSSVNDDIEKQLEFEEMCSRLRIVLDAYFPETENYRIIAEPGRYFVMGAYTLATQIIGKRGLDLFNQEADGAVVACDKQGSHSDYCTYDDCSTTCSVSNEGSFESETDYGTISQRNDISPKDTITTKGYRYVINDGVYNSFNCIVFDHAKPFPCGFFDHEGYFHEIGNQGQYFISTVYGPTCDGFDCVLQKVPLPPMEVGNWVVWPNMGAYTTAASSCFNGIQIAKKHYFMCQDDLLEMEKLCPCTLCDIEFVEVLGEKLVSQTV